MKDSSNSSSSVPAVKPINPNDPSTWPTPPTTTINPWELYRGNLSDDIRQALHKLPPSMIKDIELKERFALLNGTNPTVDVLDYLKANSRITEFQYNREISKRNRQLDYAQIDLIKQSSKLRGKDPTIPVLEYMKQKKMITKDQYDAAIANYNRVLDRRASETSQRFDNLKVANAPVLPTSDGLNRSNGQNTVHSSDKRLNYFSIYLNKANKDIDVLTQKANKEFAEKGKLSASTTSELSNFRERLGKITKLINALVQEIKTSDLSLSNKNLANKHLMENINPFKEIRKKYNDISNKSIIISQHRDSKDTVQKKQSIIKPKGQDRNM